MEPIVQFNWDIFPSTKLEASEMLAPLGCMITPASASGVLSAQGSPLRCLSCDNVVNPYIRIDRANNFWWCPFCHKTTFFPDSFVLAPVGAPNSEIPAEIRPSPNNTIDYTLPRDISQVSTGTRKCPFVSVYIIDSYQHVDSLEQREFESLKRGICKSIERLPHNARVLLVTFSDIVEVFSKEEGVAFLPLAIFNDNYDYSKLLTDLLVIGTILQKLAVERLVTSTAEKSPLARKGLLLEKSEASATVAGLKPKLTSSYKPPRATGLALFISTLLLSLCSFSNLIGNVSLFVSGPPTLSPGKVVGETEALRSHHDVANFQAQHFASASKFYRALAYVSSGYLLENSAVAAFSTSGKLTHFGVSDKTPFFSVDIYSGSLDQTGVYEMGSLASSGSGSIFLLDSFLSVDFENRLLTNTDRLPSRKWKTTFTVTSSSGIRVWKAVCHGTPLRSSYQSEKHSALHHEKISDTMSRFDSSLKKRDFTNRWNLGSIQETDALAVYFEMDLASSSSSLDVHGTKEVFIQFQSQWWDMSSEKEILRVTTIKRPTTLSILAANQVKLSSGRYKLVNQNSMILKEKALIESFEYKTWMALFTRLLVDKIDTTIGFESFEEVVDEVDQALIRLTKYYGGLHIEQSNSTNPYEKLRLIQTINNKFKDLPSYSYALRRNPQLVRIFNSSPDETAFYHHLFKRSGVEDSCAMIKPHLYKVQSDSLEEILLDITSVDPDASAPQYYVLDAVVTVIIYLLFKDPQDALPLHPSNNDDIINGSRDVDNPHLKTILDLVDAKFVQPRPNKPKVVLTQSGHSQARYIKARLNPVRDKIVVEEKKKTRWWEFFFSESPGNTLAMADEVSVKTYYSELLKRVQNFQLD